VSTMRFQSDLDKEKYMSACELKCSIDSKRGMMKSQYCTGNYVDCSRNGGYDPTDPCK